VIILSNFKTSIFKYLIILLTIGETFMFLNYCYSFTIEFETISLYDEQTNANYNDYKDYRYRVEVADQFEESEVPYAYNHSYIYGYNSVSSFNSTLYGKLSLFNNKMGIKSDGNFFISYSYTTPIYDSLFNIKYLVNYKYDNKYYDKIGDTQVYKYPLELIYGVNDYSSTLYYENFLETHNTLARDFSGVDDVLELVKYKTKTVYEDDEVIAYEYSYKANGAYFYYYDENTLFVYDSNYIYTHINNRTEYMDKLCKNQIWLLYTLMDIHYTTDKKITVVYKKSDYLNDPVIFKVNDNNFKKMYDYLSKYQANIDKIDTNGVKGNITLDKDMKVFTSIPYAKGWIAYVDGKKVDVYEIYDTFLGFGVGEGYHEFELKYEIPYLKEGLIISLSTFGLLLVYNIIKKVKYHERH
ncbi:MAG: YfhO family protein, partial [Bacilli bacterium]|nr:YfhO family protein [Bacilli bacterium]